MKRDSVREDTANAPASAGAPPWGQEYRVNFVGFHPVGFRAANPMASANIGNIRPSAARSDTVRWPDLSMSDPDGPRPRLAPKSL